MGRVVPAVPLALRVSVMVGACAVVPAASGPGTLRDTLPLLLVTVGVPEPRLEPPLSVADTNVAPVGIVNDVTWFVMLEIVWPLDEVGTVVGPGTIVIVKLLPAVTEAGAVTFTSSVSASDCDTPNNVPWHVVANVVPAAEAGSADWATTATNAANTHAAMSAESFLTSSPSAPVPTGDPQPCGRRF
jgi:hypothetical protein